MNSVGYAKHRLWVIGMKAPGQRTTVFDTMMRRNKANQRYNDIYMHPCAVFTFLLGAFFADFCFRNIFVSFCFTVCVFFDQNFKMTVNKRQE